MPARRLPTLPSTPAGAGAARRALVAVAVLVAALVAHAIAVGGFNVIPIAPALWAMLVGAAAVAGVRSGRAFRARGVPATLGVLLVGQAALHVGITYAPWAFGLDIHHERALVPGWAPLLAHVVAAVVLALLISRAEVLLAAALRIVRAITGPRRTRGRGGPAPVVAQPVLTLLRPVRGLRRPLPTRGPPLPA